tara:strand:+ start:1084 stop:1479 length:396 start_codon:yes stop_codon:yes gene_type:complete
MARLTTYNDELIEKGIDYITNCQDNLPSIVGLCLHIGRAKGLVYEWIKHPDKSELNDIVSIVNEMQESLLINKSITNEFNSKISAMMLSKFGHVEIKEIDNKSSDGSMKTYSPTDYASAQLAVKSKLADLD